MYKTQEREFHGTGIILHTGENMQILVTGGCGFIGSNFTRVMLKQTQENKIVNIDNFGIGSNRRSVVDLEKKHNYTLIEGNTINEKILKPHIQEADIIVNFAAETHVDRSIKTPRKFIENNILGTLSLLEATRKYNDTIKFIQISTDEVYGPISKGSANEHSEMNTSNPYSASKAASDMLCLAYYSTYDIDTIITRTSNNFGPYQYQEKLIPKTIVSAYKNKKIPIYGDGRQIRDWIYVTDNCRAIQKVIESGAPGQIYNISAENQIENISIVKKILQIMKKPEELIEHVTDRPGHDKRYSLDASKIRKIGWIPEENFEDALLKTVNWYLSNLHWWT